MRVCDICKKELTYKNRVDIKVEEIEIMDYNEKICISNNYEICKICRDRILDKIQEK